MGVMRTLYKMLALFCLATPCVTSAQVQPKPAEPVSFIGQYSFSWAGVYLGKLELSIQEKPDTYDLRLAVISGGVVNWFTRHENDTVANGTRTGDTYHPSFYESHYKTKKKPRHIRLQFDKDGKITEELNEPPENRALRPEVPAKLKDGSYDPLTGMMLMRSGVSTLTGFDAKRLYTVNIKDEGKETLTIMGKSTPSQHYVLSRVPLAGMTAKETKEYAAGEPPLHFYFSDDARRVPVYMSMPVFMGSVKGTLTKECATWDECKIK